MPPVDGAGLSVVEAVVSAGLFATEWPAAALASELVAAAPPTSSKAENGLGPLPPAGVAALPRSGCWKLCGWMLAGDGTLATGNLDLVNPRPEGLQAVGQLARR